MEFGDERWAPVSAEDAGQIVNKPVFWGDDDGRDVLCIVHLRLLFAKRIRGANAVLFISQAIFMPRVLLKQ